MKHTLTLLSLGWPLMNFIRKSMFYLQNQGEGGLDFFFTLSSASNSRSFLLHASALSSFTIQNLNEGFGYILGAGFKAVFWTPAEFGLAEPHYQIFH